MNDTTTNAAVRAIVTGAGDRFRDAMARVHKDTDTVFAWLMVGQWLFGVIVALAFSPYGWAGKVRAVHAHVYAATILGAAISSLPLFLTLRRPGWVGTRHVVAVAQMLWSALLIHLTGGRIETHFHVFGSLAFLSFYRDWKVLLTASVVVAADHFVRGIVWPESVYGIVNPESWRFLEHGFWVAFIDVFLIMACVRGLREMRHLAEQAAMIETQTLLASFRRPDALAAAAAPEPPTDAGGADYDEVRIEGAIGWRSVARREYEAMPLADRIRLILDKKVQFYRDGREVAAHDALGATRL